MPASRACWQKAKRDELAALIGMVDQAGTGPAARKGHVQRVDDELCAHVVGHRPAHDAAAEGVVDGSEVEPPFPRPGGGDVSDPEDVGRRRLRVALDAGHADRRAP